MTWQPPRTPHGPPNPRPDAPPRPGARSDTAQSIERVEKKWVELRREAEITLAVEKVIEESDLRAVIEAARKWEAWRTIARWLAWWYS